MNQEPLPLKIRCVNCSAIGSRLLIKFSNFVNLVRVTRCDISTKILFELVDSYVITFKFKQWPDMNTKESVRQMASCTHAYLVLLYCLVHFYQHTLRIWGHISSSTLRCWSRASITVPIYTYDDKARAKIKHVVRKKLTVLIIDNFFPCHLMVMKLCTVIELVNI